MVPSNTVVPDLLVRPGRNTILPVLLGAYAARRRLVLFSFTRRCRTRTLVFHAWPTYTTAAEEESSRRETHHYQTYSHQMCQHLVVRDPATRTAQEVLAAPNCHRLHLSRAYRRYRCMTRLGRVILHRRLNREGSAKRIKRGILEHLRSIMPRYTMQNHVI